MEMVNNIFILNTHSVASVTRYILHVTTAFLLHISRLYFYFSTCTSTLSLNMDDKLLLYHFGGVIMTIESV
jgi:hypothetical protein